MRRCVAAALKVLVGLLICKAAWAATPGGAFFGSNCELNAPSIVGMTIDAARGWVVRSGARVVVWDEGRLDGRQIPAAKMRYDRVVVVVVRDRRVTAAFCH